MIFTLGRTRNYEQFFRDQVCPRKKGRDDSDPTGPYDGGSVWRTLGEAQGECPPGFSVYGVAAEWDVDTETSRNGDPWHDLLRDSELVRLPDRMAESPDGSRRGERGREVMGAEMSDNGSVKLEDIHWESPQEVEQRMEGAIQQLRSELVSSNDRLFALFGAMEKFDQSLEIEGDEVFEYMPLSLSAYRELLRLFEATKQAIGWGEA